MNNEYDVCCTILIKINFWYRFFELKSFYSYVESVVFNFKRNDIDNFIVYISNMATRLHIENSVRIIQLIDLHLQTQKISFPLFQYKLTTLYFTDFFFTIKSN